MYKELSIEDLREVLHGELIVTYTVETCKACNGLGYRYVEEGLKPSRKCITCAGDGRVLKKKTRLIIECSEEEEQVPLVLSGDYENMMYYQRQHVRYKLDRRDIYLENKYPELKDKTYEKYDELLKKYHVLEELKGKDNE